MTEAVVKYQYKSPEGEVVETSSHEYYTRLKGLGYVFVPQTKDEQQEVQLQNEQRTAEQDAGVQQQAELTVEQTEEREVQQEVERRVRRDRDNQRG